MVYSVTLAHAHWSINLLLINMLGFLAMKYYSRVESTIEQNTNDKDFADDADMIDTFKEAYLPLIIIGTSGFLGFALMLPWIFTQSAAIYFLLAASVARVIIVPLSIKVFDDRMGNQRLYWFGFIMSLLGMILYKIMDIVLFEENLMFLLCSLLYMANIIFRSIFSRYFTSKPSKARSKSHILGISYVYIPVPVKVRWSIIMESILFALTYIYVSLSSGGIDFLLEPFYGLDLNAILGLLWIGVVVTLSGTLAFRYKIELGETITGAVEGYRPIVSLIVIVPIINFLTGNLEQVELMEYLGALVAAIGAYVASLAKPSASSLKSGTLMVQHRVAVNNNNTIWSRAPIEDLVEINKSYEEEFIAVANTGFGIEVWSHDGYLSSIVRDERRIYKLLHNGTNLMGFVFCSLIEYPLDGSKMLWIHRMALHPAAQKKGLGLAHFLKRFRLENVNENIGYVGLKTQNPGMYGSVNALSSKLWPFSEKYDTEEGKEILNFISRNTLELTDKNPFKRDMGILPSLYGRRLGNYFVSEEIHAAEQLMSGGTFDRDKGDAFLVVGKLGNKLLSVLRA